MKTTPHRLYAIFGTALGLAQITMVWFHRYLPMYDYPIWLYEVKCLHRLVEGNEAYTRVFECATGPVPNMAFVGGASLLSLLFSLETSGKILLSLCIIGFPWSWLWVVRRVVGEYRGLEYLGFPLTLNLFFWGRTSYLLALIVFVVAVGWLYLRRNDSNVRLLIALAGLSVVFFFLHGAILALWCLVASILLFSSPGHLRDKLKMIGVALSPAVVLALWHHLSVGVSTTVQSTWGFVALARNLLKPLMLFVKSYELPSMVPLSLLNGLWLLLLCISMVPVGRWLLSRNGVRQPLFPTIVLCLLAAVILPNDAFGISSPGGYCVLPAIFLMIISGPRAEPSRWRAVPLLLVTLVLTAYTFHHVQRVDTLMSEFVGDIRRNTTSSNLHLTIRYDWPAGSGAFDAISASVNPLFGAHYYSLLETDGIAIIHGTSLLRVRSDSRWLHPPFSGATRQKYHESVLDNVDWCRRFVSISVTGSNPEAAETVALLQTMRFSTVCAKPLWTILVNAQRPEEQ